MGRGIPMIFPMVVTRSRYTNRSRWGVSTHARVIRNSTGVSATAWPETAQNIGNGSAGSAILLCASMQLGMGVDQGGVNPTTPQ